MSEEIKDMETKANVVSEPAVGYALNEYPMSDLVSEIDYDFQGKDFGYPKSLEELELALDEAYAERNDPSKWITPVEFHTRLESKYPWLR